MEEKSTWMKQIDNIISQERAKKGEIFIRDKHIQDIGVDYVVNLNLSHAVSINLSSNLITKEGALFISTAQWPYLQSLSLCTPINYKDKNQIRNQGIYFLKDSHWYKLQKLQLGSNDIGNKGIKYLTIGLWTQLTSLKLQDNQIDDAGIVHLQKGNWKKLQTLNLNKNKIDDKAIIHLTKANWKLSNISLQQNLLKCFGCIYLMYGEWNLDKQTQITAINSYFPNKHKQKCYYDQVHALHTNKFKHTPSQI